MSDPPIAIEVTGVDKSFRLPLHRVDTLKERTLHPFTSGQYTELRALEDVSFEIRSGEFMGIAGRNGSGKTTLLKLLASIYRPDRGRIRIAGRVAPFIELGVGFNPDLASKENILLNGVMMGLTPRQSRERADRVIEFAELEEFVELKLKNYSSGMRVRLGFAMLLEADAEVLLIDEVLAVGDASFQQKCTDAFYDLHARGKTIVLVTHAMEKLNEYCDRAILFHEGRIDSIGDPGHVAERYFELNFKSGDREAPGDAAAEPPAGEQEVAGPARIEDFWLEDGSGQRTDSFRHGEPIRLCGVVQVLDEIEGSPSFGFQVFDPNGTRIIHLRSPDLANGEGALKAGERVRIDATVANPLGSGRYSVGIGLSRHRDLNDALALRVNAAEFIVFGAEAPGGYPALVCPEYEFSVERSTTTELAPR